MSYRSASARAVAFDDALREAMSATVPDAIQPECSPAADPAAGTARPEGVAVERVTADPAVSDPGSAPPDRDRVEHDSEWPAKQWRVKPGAYTSGLAEAIRQGRLRRWQAAGERRT